MKWKIFAFLLGFCALLLIILWLFQTVFLDAFYKKIRVMDIRRNAGIIANNADNENIMEIIDNIADSSDIVIDITDLNGRSVLTPLLMQDRRLALENAIFISQAINNNGEYLEYFTLLQISLRPTGWSRPQSQSLVYVMLADHTGDRQIAIIIRAVISPVDSTVTTLRYQLYFISGIMLACSVILAIIIAKRVSKPIEEISISALALAKGNYDTHFAGKGFREITALSDTLNTAAADLGRVESLRRELLANVSHDLRTPLSLIYSYAEMMHDFREEITSEQIQAIMDETQRLATLVNDVLDISKLEADIDKLNISCFNLTQCVQETTERVKELLIRDSFEITFTFYDEVYVSADETKVNRVIYNLLINAVNYSGDSHSVLVWQTVADGRVRISVTDKGEGIAEADLPFIWERYYKSGKIHKRAVTGTGLGLSIVKKIMDLHGGNYGVESEVGKGSTFWVELTI